MKNTDLSINGHISDAGQWVTQTLEQSRREQLSPEAALELAIYLNGQPKRINKGRDKVIPVESLLAYCQSMLVDSAMPMYTGADLNEANPPSNVVYLNAYKGR